MIGKIADCAGGIQGVTWLEPRLEEGEASLSEVRLEIESSITPPKESKDCILEGDNARASKEDVVISCFEGSGVAVETGASSSERLDEGDVGGFLVVPSTITCLSSYIMQEGDMVTGSLGRNGRKFGDWSWGMSTLVMRGRSDRRGVDCCCPTSPGAGCKELYIQIERWVRTGGFLPTGIVTKW